MDATLNNAQAATESDPVPELGAAIELSAAPAKTPASESCAPPLVPMKASHHWAILLLSVIVITLSAVLRIEDRQYVIIPVLNAKLPGTCTFKSTLGLDCPGCGLTRCFISCGHADFAAGWSYNPAGMAAYLIFAAQIPLRLVQLWRQRHGLRSWDAAWLTWAIPVVAMAMILQWIGRMLGEFL